MAERRGDGEPPDGHDPTVRPDSAPLLAKFIWMLIIVIMADPCAHWAQQQACHIEGLDRRPWFFIVSN
jgi:hypothetical protein